MPGSLCVGDNLFTSVGYDDDRYYGKAAGKALSLPPPMTVSQGKRFASYSLFDLDVMRF